MLTKDFTSEMLLLGYLPNDMSGLIVVYKENDVDLTRLAQVSMKEEFTMNTNFSSAKDVPEDDKRKICEACYKLAITPLDERKKDRK